MEKYRKRTKYFVIVVLVLIIIYDFWVWKKAGVPSTISQVMADWTVKYAPLNHLLMFTLGHFLWPTYVEKEGE